MSELPESWTLTSLVEIADIMMGQSPPSTTYNTLGIGLPFFQGKAEFGKLYPSVEKWCSEPVRVAEKDDILITVRAPVGPTNLAPSKCCIGRGLSAIRGKGDISTKYLLFFFRSIERWLGQQGTGSTFTAINRDFLEELSVPLAPLNEQKRIVAKLDELLPKVEACKQRLEKIPTILKRFRQSVLADAVSGRLTGEWRRKKYSDDETENDIPKGWKVIKLGDVIVKLDQGWSPKCENFPAISEAQWAVMKTTAVQPGKFLPDENKQLPSSLEAKPNLEVREGDLLITRAGPRVRCGVTCLVKATRKHLLICDKVYRFRVDECEVMPEYVEIFLNASSTLLLLDELKTGISDSGVNLTQDKFRNIDFALPSLAEQKEIVRFVHELSKDSEIMENRWTRASAQIVSMGDALLVNAFSGSLVPQDTNDEPASILLERIKSSAPAPTQKKAPSGKRKAAKEPQSLSA